MFAGDIIFFHPGITGQLDHIHTIPQGAGNTAQIVGRSNEQNMAQIVRNIQEMVIEGAVLFRVQGFQQSGCGVAPEISCQFIDLVQQHQRVGTLGRDHGRNDLTRHRANIGAAMTTDLGFIPHTTQAQAHIFAPKALGDGTSDTGLTHTRRACQTDDLCLDVRRQFAHSQDLQNTVLDLFQTIVVPVQDLLRPGNVQIIHRKGIPRQVQAGVQIGADDRSFLVAALHLGKAIHLFQQLFLAVLGQVQFLDTAAVFIRFGMGVVPFSQLIVDHMELFVQVILPLVAVHCFVDLISDLLFHTHHLALPPQHLDQTLQTARQGVFIHDRLLILIAEQKIGGDVFAQKYRVIAGNDGEHHIFAQTGVHAQVFKQLFRLRSNASRRMESSALTPRTGAGRTDASRKLPLPSRPSIFARVLPSTRTLTNSSETRSTCLTSATTP